jgi:hypothetical protein
VSARKHAVSGVGLESADKGLRDRYMCLDEADRMLDEGFEDNSTLTTLD